MGSSSSKETETPNTVYVTAPASASAPASAVTASAPAVTAPASLSVIKPDTRDYGKFYFMSFVATIYCRMAYLNSHDFLNVYKSTFGGDEEDNPPPIIPAQILKDINAGIKKENNLGDILNDDGNFSLTSETKVKYGVPIIIEPETPTGKTEIIKDENIKYNLPFLDFANKFNILLGEQPDGDAKNCDLNKNANPQNKSLVFVTIDSTEYGSVFVFADKRFPSLVNVLFRGTSSFNDALVYMRPSSLVPTKIPCPGINGDVEVIYGIYNALSNIINAIMCAVDSVALQCNPNLKELPPGSIKIVTTGHSLGGALCSYFAFKYIFFPEYRESRPYLDKDICCIALAAPVVFSEFCGAIFFCVVKKNAELINNSMSLIKTDSNLKFIKDKIEAIQNYDTIGRIVFLNVIISNDPVASLPLFFTRPGEWKELSKFKSAEIKKEKGESTLFGKKKEPYISKYLPSLKNIGEEQDLEQCVVEVKTPFTSRCLFDNKTIVHTSDLLKNPPKCTDTIRAFTLFPSKMGPVFLNFVVYHTEYLGIAFAKAFTNVKFGKLSKDITYNTATGTNKSFKKGSDLVRLIFYPAISGNNYNYDKANIIFYPLNAVREHDEDDELRENQERELAMQAELLEDEMHIELDPSSIPQTNSSEGLVPILDAVTLEIEEDKEQDKKPQVASPKKQAEIDNIWLKMKNVTKKAIELVSKFPIIEDLNMNSLYSKIVPFIKTKNNQANQGNAYYGLLDAMNDTVDYNITEYIAPVNDHEPFLTEKKKWKK